ncbi:MAG: hypothetical protein IPP78_08725 [Holophagaceae bacterium]|nr:hypothetical protein [Holophagaceae bacterium]
MSYRSGTRRVELQVIDGNHPAFIALRPEQGELALLREFFLTHTGPEKMIAANANTLKQTAPAAWKVTKHRGAKLIRTDDATYWCYTPGLVLPVTFHIGQTAWKLQSAELPPLMFVEVQ